MNERIDVFLAYLQGERSLSPNTVSAYRNDLLQFADYMRSEAERQGGTDFALSTIDRDQITSHFLHLRDRGYSAASIARKTAALRSFFQYLRRTGEVANDPTQGIGSPEVKKPLPRTIEDNHVRALLTHLESRDTPEGSRDHAMLRLLIATHQIGEGLALEDLRQLLGHASIATTQIYTQLPVTSAV